MKTAEAKDMTNETMQPENGLNIHTYKNKPWVILYSLLSLVFLGIVLLFPLILVTTLITAFSKDATNYEAVKTSLLCAFTPLAAAFGLIIIQQVIGSISAFYSYIKVSPEGIEHKVWPYRHIRANWSQVERIGQFFLYEALYLKSYEVIGLSLSHSWPWKYLNFSQTPIALSTYNGWPNGELANDLRRYAPLLFESRLGTVETQAQNPSTLDSRVTQESRLLAALSHASVLFTGVGVVVPLVIYLSQKQKSAYLAFHALQALLYQLVGTIIGFLLPFCMIGAFLLPAIGLSVPDSENTSGPLFLVTMGLTGVIAVVVVFASIAYGIYGIIGAILAYQGKDFSYVVIGKRVKRRNPQV